MPLPLIPLIGMAVANIARVATPAIIRAVAPKIISKPVLQAATKVVPKAAAPKAVPKALPAAPKAATPKPAAAKPTPKPATPAAKTTTTKPTTTATKAPAKPPTKAPAVVKKVGTVGAVGAVASIPSSSSQSPPRASGSSSGSTSSPPTTSRVDPGPGNGPGGSGPGSSNIQDNGTTQGSVEEYPDIVFDPEVYPEPVESGGGIAAADSGSNTEPPPPPIKSAPIDTVLFNDEQVSAEIIADLLFENIGGQEILTIARHDTVNGQDVTYQPIKNLSAIQQQYSAESLVKIKSTARDIFGNFPIDIQSKIPNVGGGPNGASVYLEEATGNIIIEFVNLENGQEVEVQITSSGTIESIGE